MCGWGEHANMFIHGTPVLSNIWDHGAQLQTRALHYILASTNTLLHLCIQNTSMLIEYALWTYSLHNITPRFHLFKNSNEQEAIKGSIRIHYCKYVWPPPPPPLPSLPPSSVRLSGGEQRRRQGRRRKRRRRAKCARQSRAGQSWR